MLIQSSLPGSIEDALPFASNHGNQNQDLFDWNPDTEMWQTCPKCEHPQDSCRQSFSGTERKDDDQSCSITGICSQISVVGNMCATSAPKCVYRRRKLQRKHVTLFPVQADVKVKESCGCWSTLSSEMPLLPTEINPIDPKIELNVEGIRPVIPTEACNRDVGNRDATGSHLYPPKVDDVPCLQSNCTRGYTVASKTDYIYGSSVREVHGFDEVQDNDVYGTVTEYCSVNDSCSSSKSNMELGSVSMKTEVEDTGECSSSDILVLEELEEDLSAKDICIHVLKIHGLLEVWPTRTCSSTEVLGTNNEDSFFQPCKICSHSDKTLNMLICDHCEEAFHVSCCNPRIRKIPIDEWFCQHCIKKKRKLSLEGANGLKTTNEMSDCRNGASKNELGPIAFMLKDTRPYTSGVRIGKDFQAEVPDWSGPVFSDVNYLGGEPLEMDPIEFATLHEWNSDKSSKPSSIGNWLQCREVLYDENNESIGRICGKWRRAPLFEVQTDDWDCSCSVLWDPIHADCAVPQEIETEQVLMHLKYIELVVKQNKECLRLQGRTTRVGLPESINGQHRFHYFTINYRWYFQTCNSIMKPLQSPGIQIQF